jgi:dihydropteroate synthase
MTRPFTGIGGGRRPPGVLRLGRRTFGPDQLLVMAVVCPDLDDVRAALAEGADIVELRGGPGEEITAFIRIVRGAYPDLVIGVSTGQQELGREACAAGADLILGGLAEVAGPAVAEAAGPAVAEAAGPAVAEAAGPAVAEAAGLAVAGVAAEFGAGVVCPDALVAHVVGAGVDPDRIIVEPVGFTGENVSSSLADLVARGWPVLVDAAAEDELTGTLARTAVRAWLGVRVFRAREVRETRRVLRMVSAIRGDVPPARAVRGLA